MAALGILFSGVIEKINNKKKTWIYQVINKKKTNT